jgi:para-nitrobenzyl esterase
MGTSGKQNKPVKLYRLTFEILLGFASICIVVLAEAPIASADHPPIAVTESGLVIGTTANGINEFLGIPYAAPPVGPLRWRPPKPYGFFHGLVFQATQFGNLCFQPDALIGPFGSEDCLSLNVYVPSANRPPHDLPVMVWIHGGGLVSGAGFFYDPTPLVQKGGVIVVTINYRLGYLGFFAQPALDKEGHLAGNYGLMDQQFVLQWIRRNIAGFGGDRNRVTIMGESAGGVSIYSNLASPTAAGLFQGAIAESGAYASFAGHFPFTDYLASIVSLETGESTGSFGFDGLVPSGIDAATSVGCASQTASCLRAVSASTLVLAEPGLVWPFVDGTLLTQPPGEAIGSGKFNHVPVISGSNHDEYRYFVALAELDSGIQLTAADYPQAVYSFFGLPGPPPDNMAADAVIALYPLSADSSSPSIELGALGTDVDFACPARNAGLSLSRYVPTYDYEFNDVNPPPVFQGVSFPMGDSHFVELEYLFDLEGFGITPTFTPAQQELSDTMIGYWTQFAKTGNPNSAGGPKWSRYSAGGSIESLMGPTPASETDASFDLDHKCSSYWNTF